MYAPHTHEFDDIRPCKRLPCVHLALAMLHVVQGVTTLPTARDVCTWSDIIFLCGSYDDAYNFLRKQGRLKALKGKCVLQLVSGTPEEALTASKLAKSAGAKYLDAFLFVRFFAVLPETCT